MKSKFSLEEVKKHNTIDSCWLIINRDIYDITDYLKYHPIGSIVILKKGGMDVSLDYKFHSKITQKYWKNYYIGKLI